MWLLPKATCRPSDFGGASAKIVHGTVNVREFRKRFGVKRLAMSSD
ncbi:hypothetical protein SAMN05443248_8927 [Bradyrhizobium erythrophlei]|jgi:hypothetical protein|uniref:Uncharacterized protein n=1 Tax=Bradyrhizobium erythrophlei TaxID=1437360 RepID=A0A1M5YXC8_9BRAD|nr:hypothetical protein SAMN05443248_8927 [Bradyrhizobium erythrophlei]